MKASTHSEEYPLQHFAIVIWTPVAIKGELQLRVVVLLQIEEDGGGLEDGEIVSLAVDKHGYPAIWVELDEPGLLLNILGYVYLLYALMWCNLRELIVMHRLSGTHS